jgi:hypothetical protein
LIDGCHNDFESRDVLVILGFGSRDMMWMQSRVRGCNNLPIQMRFESGMMKSLIKMKWNGDGNILLPRFVTFNSSHLDGLQ